MASRRAEQHKPDNVLAAVAAPASYLPTRRATKADPMVASGTNSAGRTFLACDSYRANAPRLDRPVEVSTNLYHLLFTAFVQSTDCTFIDFHLNPPSMNIETLLRGNSQCFVYSGRKALEISVRVAISMTLPTN